MANYGEEISTISLGSIIGGTLNAMVEAQSQAANTTVQYIDSVGFETKDGIKTPRYVNLEYSKDNIQSGEQQRERVTTKMSVPVLSMVPIPYIRINDATIDFNVKINSVEESKKSDENTWGGSTEAHADYNGWRFKSGIKLNASISNQKKSMSSDSVKRDYSLNVHVHAVQDDMPAGVERLLNFLENSASMTQEIEKVDGEEKE